jgi:hypothetical protein
MQRIAYRCREGEVTRGDLKRKYPCSLSAIDVDPVSLL